MEKLDPSRIEAIRSAAKAERMNPTPPDLSILSHEHTYCLLRHSHTKLAEEGLQKTQNKILDAWNKVDIEHVLAIMDNTSCLYFVHDNAARLIAKDMYEKALLSAYVGTRTNFSSLDFSEIRLLFELADVEKLRSAGDPIPERESFTVYRGVAGHGAQRRVNGYSWTDSLNMAAWYAMRWKVLGLEDPAVYEATVSQESVLAVCHDRQESEFILRVPLPVKPQRLRIMPKPNRSGG